MNITFQHPAARLALSGLLALVLAVPARAALFDETLVHAGADRGVAVATTDDGGACVAGIGPPFGVGGMNIQVTRLDADGSVVFQTLMGWHADDLGLGVEDGGDGGCVVVGSLDRDGDRQAFVASLGPTGSILTRFELGGPGLDQLADIERTPDGGFMAAGSTSSGSGSNDAWLVKLQPDLTVAWQKAYGELDRSEFAWSLRTRGDDVAVIGQAERAGDPLDRNVLFFVVDATGNILLQVQFGAAGRIAQGFDVATSCAGDFVVGGLVDAVGWVARVDDSGALDWQHRPGAGFGAVHAVTRLDAQRVVTASQGGATGSLITAWQADGSLSWQRWHSTSNVLDVQVSSDGGLLYAGYVGSGPTEEIRVTRADAQGAACTDGLVAWAPSDELLREIDCDLIITPTDFVPVRSLIALDRPVPTPSGCTAPADPGPWSKAWAASSLPSTVAVATRGDGTHAVLTERFATATSVHAMVVDSANAVIAEHVYASPFVAPRDLVATVDGGYAMVGASSGGDAALVRLNPSLAPVGAGRLGGTGYERIDAVAQLVDGALLVAGVTTPSGGSADAWLAVIEPLGAIRWLSVLAAAGSQGVQDVIVVNEDMGMLAGSTGPPARPWLVSFDLATGAPIWDAQLDFGGTPAFAEIAALAVGEGDCGGGFGPGPIAAVGTFGKDPFFFTFEPFPTGFGPVTFYAHPNGDFATSVVAAPDGDFVIGGIRSGASPLTAPIPWLMRVSPAGVPSVDSGHALGLIPSGRPRVALAPTGYVLAHDNQEVNEIVVHRIGMAGNGPVACPEIPLTRAPRQEIPIPSSIGPIPSDPGWTPQPFLVTSTSVTLPSYACP